MREIMVDDHTYTVWKKQATAHGLSIEEWLKQKTATAVTKIDQRAPEELTAEEWKARFNNFMAETEKMNIGSEGGVDWSRDAIYGERGL